MNIETEPALEPDEAAQAAALVILVANERAADIAETLNEELPAVAAAVLLGLPKDRAIEILDQPILDSSPEIVSLLPRETAVALLAGVSADRVADLCRKLEEPHRTELLDRLDPDTRAHCLTQNVTGQLLADDWGGVTESVRWPLWRERSAWARGARWCRR